MKLSVLNVRALSIPRGKSEAIFFDDDLPGFGVRLRGDSRTWVFQYKIGTQHRRMTLGRVAAVKLPDARETAEKLHAQVVLGRDPQAEKEIRVIQAGDNLGGLAKRYLDFQETALRARSFTEVKRHLNLYAKPLHKLTLTAVDRKAIAGRLDSVAKESGAITANRVRATLSAMFSWAMREGLVDSNPVMNTTKREEKTRDRVLSDAELKVIWQNLGDDHFGDIVKLLMLTGQRASEIAGLRWSEINLERNLITLPAERTKNARPHELPITATVRAIIEKQHQRTDANGEKRDLIFGFGGGAFSGWSNCKETLDGKIKLPHWVIHDLRRTVATRMVDIGTQPHVVEAVLNHISGHKGGIAGVYNRARYTAEKAQALARWDEHVSALVTGTVSNVTPLKRA